MTEPAIDTLFDALRAYDLPVGVYVVRRKDGQEIIVRANHTFARILGYDSVEEVEGHPVTDFIESSEGQQEFKEALEFASRRDEPLYSHQENLRARGGRIIPVELHVQQDRDPAGYEIGRTGIITPVSELNKLLGDIGTVMHRYSHALVTLRERLAIIHSAVEQGEDPFGDPLRAPTVEEVDAVLVEQAAQLNAALSKLLESAPEGSRAFEALDPDQWEILNLKQLLLDTYQDDVLDLPLRPAMLQLAAHEIGAICRAARRGYLAREVLKDTADKAAELERLVCLAEVHLATSYALEMQQEVLALREVAVYSVRERAPREVMTLLEIVEDGFRTLESYADSRGVQVRISSEPRSISVEVSRRDIVRAVQNLLHNAIKYSWTKPTGPVWIEVACYVSREMGNGKLPVGVIEVQNYGVPIMPDEIEKVFDLGYRGRISTDKKRSGTGVGLFDARRVARAHGGEVRIESQPASASDYDPARPFLTTARLILPLKRD
ncbi:MAG: hypothetical protein Kow00124_30130 [Anaerolineae bacterium]